MKASLSIPEENKYYYQGLEIDTERILHKQTLLK